MGLPEFTGEDEASVKGVEVVEVMEIVEDL
jgi:hypothetical protein